MMVLALKRTLKTAGYEVLATTSSQEAIQRLGTEPFDLVITDVNMPDPDGIELLRFALKENLAMPFIVISGNESPLRMFREARLLGAVFTLAKPISTEALIECVEAALDRKYGSKLPRNSARPDPNEKAE